MSKWKRDNCQICSDRYTCPLKYKERKKEAKKKNE